jgi:hypothetical protein
MPSTLEVDLYSAAHALAVVSQQWIDINAAYAGLATHIWKSDIRPELCEPIMDGTTHCGWSRERGRPVLLWQSTASSAVPWHVSLGLCADTGKMFVDGLALDALLPALDALRYMSPDSTSSFHERVLLDAQRWPRPVAMDAEQWMDSISVGASTTVARLDLLVRVHRARTAMAKTLAAAEKAVRVHPDRAQVACVRPVFSAVSIVDGAESALRKRLGAVEFDAIFMTRPHMRSVRACDWETPLFIGGTLPGGACAPDMDGFTLRMCSDEYVRTAIDYRPGLYTWLRRM